MEQHPPPAFADTMHANPPGLALMAAIRPATKHYPVALRCVRALFLKTEYRKCVSTCHDLLQNQSYQSNPIHKAFLLFYSAIAYDEMGRAMHHNSIAKIPALDSAEQLYLAAIHALPSPKEADLLCIALVQESRAAAFLEHDECSPIHNDFDRFDEASFLSSPARDRSDSISVQSSNPSRRAVASELDDLESHDSFSELMTPNRVLNRQDSRITLREDTTPMKRPQSEILSSNGRPAPARMQRDFSRMSLFESPQRKPVSQGLLRPIRPGSPPHQLYIPLRLQTTPPVPSAGHTKQTTQQTRGSSSPKSIANAHDYFYEGPHVDTEPVSPLSEMEMESDCYLSDVSTISAISPLTPTRSRNVSFSSDRVHDRDQDLDHDHDHDHNHGHGHDHDLDIDHDLNESLCLRFNDHLDSMRKQLETHITLVQQTKEKLRGLQADRASSKVAPITGTPLRGRPGVADRSSCPPGWAKDPEVVIASGGLPRVRSYWSFVPVDAKAAEKQRRIKAGRERRWARKTERFNPTKYQDLCERALNEL